MSCIEYEYDILLGLQLCADLRPSAVQMFSQVRLSEESLRRNWLPRTRQMSILLQASWRVEMPLSATDRCAVAPRVQTPEISWRRSHVQSSSECVKGSGSSLTPEDNLQSIMHYTVNGMCCFSAGQSLARRWIRAISPLDLLSN